MRSKDNQIEVFTEGKKVLLKPELSRNVTIYKSTWARGFYVDLPYFTKQNASISLQFIDFNGNTIEKWDD